MFTIGDIVNNKVQFLSKSGLSSRYNLRINNLSYIGLISAIPKTWVDKITTYSQDKFDNNKPKLDTFLRQKNPIG